ncbi:MAG: SDR family oxidoreductase [Alphaproteobacteria bacterium]
MKMANNTILITGGSSGIGLELASELLKRGNTVIVTGRNQSNLDAARAKVPGLSTIQSDVSDPGAIRELYQKVIAQYPDLNVLVNNAGIMRKINLHQAGPDLKDVTREIEINLNGPIWMVSQFLPHLKTQKASAIVNVSSGLAFVPMAISPIYSASKAAIHAYTQALRMQLKNTNIAVFELAPPGTETPLFRGDFSADDVGGARPMDVKTLVKLAIAGIERDRLEIRPGLSNVLKLMSRIAPNFILKQLGKPVDSMLAKAKS